MWKVLEDCFYLGRKSILLICFTCELCCHLSALWKGAIDILLDSVKESICDSRWVLVHRSLSVFFVQWAQSYSGCCWPSVTEKYFCQSIRQRMQLKQCQEGSVQHWCLHQKWGKISDKSSNFLSQETWKRWLRRKKEGNSKDKSRNLWNWKEKAIAKINETKVGSSKKINKINKL